MIRLIVNADDLGSGMLRDRGIFAAFTRGIVTSASLLANGSTFTRAAREARTCSLPTGVHLNLSEGRSLTGVIQGLTDPAGNFPGKIALRNILVTGTFDSVGIHRELLAQIERVRGTGLKPDHLDTHQHCLLFPVLTAIITDVAEASGIRALRLPLPAEPGEGGTDGLDSAAFQVGPSPAGDMSPAVSSETGFPRKDAHNPGAEAPSPDAPAIATELALYRQLAPAARAALQAGKLWTPDGLWGMPLLNRLDETALAATLASIPAGTWELMTHPGYRDAGDPFGGPEREAELQALTAPAIRRLVAARRIELTSFGACACAC